MGTKRIIVGQGNNYKCVYNHKSDERLEFHFCDEFLKKYYKENNVKIVNIPSVNEIVPSIENYQNTLMDNHILKNVNLLGYNVEEAKIIYQSIALCAKYFPNLVNCVHYFGSKKGFLESMDKLNDDVTARRFNLGFIKKEKRDRVKNFLKEYIKQSYQSSEMKLGNAYGIAFDICSFTRYSFIDEDDLTKNKAKDYYKRLFYDELDSLSSSALSFVTCHELMHMLDLKYSLTKSVSKVMVFLNNLDLDDYKKQIRFNDNLKEEKFANIMARYICSNKKVPIAVELFNIVNSIINK